MISICKIIISNIVGIAKNILNDSLLIIRANVSV